MASQVPCQNPGGPDDSTLSRHREVEIMCAAHEVVRGHVGVNDRLDGRSPGVEINLMTPVEECRDLGQDPGLGDPRETAEDEGDSHERTRFSELAVSVRGACSRAYWPASVAHLM